MELTVKNLCFAYQKNHPVFTDISFNVSTPEIFCILGANGAGKSTLLKCLANQHAASSGQIFYDEQLLHSFSMRELAKKIAYIPQTHAPAFPFSVLDIVMMGRAAYLGSFSSPGNREKKLAEEKLALLGIEQLAGKSYTDISGGERQLVMLASALAQEPQMLLLDEPTAHLDFGRQYRFLDILHLLKKQGIGILMTSHFPDHALRAADTTAILKDGTFAHIGPSADVVTSENLTALYNVPIQVISLPEYDQKICLPEGALS
jgi:iron complex transport system ATP-binding protein